MFPVLIEIINFKCVDGNCNAIVKNVKVKNEY